MKIAILDAAHGISGDMMLGALVDLGLDAQWLLALPGVLGLDGVVARITDVTRGEIACKKVDFDIPPQPHGRHLKHIKAIVDGSPAPDDVKAAALDAFTRSARWTPSSTAADRSGDSSCSGSRPCTPGR